MKRLALFLLMVSSHVWAQSFRSCSPKFTVSQNSAFRLTEIPGLDQTWRPALSGAYVHVGDIPDRWRANMLGSSFKMHVVSAPGWNWSTIGPLKTDAFTKEMNSRNIQPWSAKITKDKQKLSFFGDGEPFLIQVDKVYGGNADRVDLTVCRN